MEDAIEGVDFFSCVWRGSRLHSGAVTSPVVIPFLRRASEWRFLSDEHWVAEPGAACFCARPCAANRDGSRSVGGSVDAPDTTAVRINLAFCIEVAKVASEHPAGCDSPPFEENGLGRMIQH